jgi:hypothetical protein
MVKNLTDSASDGARFGAATSDLIAFHGATPISQRTAAILTDTSSLFALTGASYIAATTATVSGLFGFNSTVLLQVWNAINEIRDALVAYGLHKGGA